MNLRLALVALGLLSALPAVATPVYYTFSGSVTSSDHPGFQIDQAVTYVFMADQSVPGYLTFNGSIRPTSHSELYFFYSKYLGGDAIQNEGWEAYYGIVESFSGTTIGPEFRGQGTTYSYLTGSNEQPIGSDQIHVSTYENQIDVWYIGQSFAGRNQATTGMPHVNPNGHFLVNSSLTLVAISETNPYEAVPEPSTVILFGLGSILLVGYQRRKYGKGKK